MNNRFDELAKGLAQSVTRRQALRRFGAGLAGMALACFGVRTASAGRTGYYFQGYCSVIAGTVTGGCLDPNKCVSSTLTSDCPMGAAASSSKAACGQYYAPAMKCKGFVVLQM